VNSVRSSTISLLVNAGDSVESVQAMIEVKTGIPTSCQSLIYSGRCMSPGRQISDYSIDNNATIELNLRLLGGMPNVMRGKRQNERRLNSRREARCSAFEDTSKGAGQEYGWVLRHLGNRRVAVQCEDGLTRQCLIRYRPAKFGRQYISQGNLVLIGIREFSEEIGDVLHRYSEEDSKKLIALGHVRKPPNSEFDDLLNSDPQLGIDDDIVDFVFEDI